jgi:hypothetical protein
MVAVYYSDVCPHKGKPLPLLPPIFSVSALIYCMFHVPPRPPCHLSFEQTEISNSRKMI